MTGFHVMKGFHSIKSLFCSASNLKVLRSFGGVGLHRNYTMATSSSGNQFHDDIIKYLDEVHQVIIKEALVKGTSRDTKVIDFKQPEELQKLIDLPICKGGASHEELVELCRNTIKYSVHTANPFFMNQLYAGRDPYSLSASWIVESLNTNQHTYETAPVFIIVEKYIIEKVSEIVGYSEGDGLFTAGGNMANMLGFHLARFNKDKNIKNTGLPDSKPMVLYASDGAHYSITTAASFLGFGLNNTELIKTDHMGRLIPEELESTIKRNIQEGKIPLSVMATSGTTVLGAFDPINPIADICEKYGLWLHVDGAWGGAAMLSDKYRHLMDGVHRADSVLWNAHKMMAAQIQCSVFVTKHKGLLRETNSSHADYLYQPDKVYDVSWDRGDISIQCGRKADAYKLWLMWKARGEQGMADIVDSHFQKAAYFTEKLKQTEGFRLVLPEVAPQIKARMQLKGSMLIGYQPIASKGWVNFWRIIISNTAITESDLDKVIEEIVELGKDL